MTDVTENCVDDYKAVGGDGYSIVTCGPYNRDCNIQIEAFHRGGEKSDENDYAYLRLFHEGAQIGLSEDRRFNNYDFDIKKLAFLPKNTSTTYSIEFSNTSCRTFAFGLRLVPHPN